jgi:hypothetical protein
VALSFDVTNGTVDSYEIYEAKRPWDENQATWNAASAGQNWQTPGAQGANDRGSTVLGVLTGGAGAKTFNLNAAGMAVVQKWIDNPATNFGFVIQDYSASSDDLRLRSREAAALASRPKITIVYANGGASFASAPRSARVDSARASTESGPVPTPLDLLRVINVLNGPKDVGAPVGAGVPTNVPDVNHDGITSPLDALLMINQLIRQRATVARLRASDALLAPNTVDNLATTPVIDDELAMALAMARTDSIGDAI